MIATIPETHHRRADRGAVRIEPPPKGTIKQAITIAKPRADVMRAWRDLGMPDDAIFLDAPAELGTEVVLEIPHAAPESALGSAFTTLMKQNPADAAATALRQIKEQLETGEVPTTEGQPSGRNE